MKQSAAESPLRVFGAMLAYYRTRAGMTPEQLGARVFVSGSQIRKVEAGTRTPTEDLAKACEGVGELGCNGALTELYEILGEKLKRRAYPGWFAAWPDKEAQARRLRSFELVVVPGLLQTEAYARAVLSTRVGATEDEIDEAVAARLARQKILEREHPPELWVILDEGVLRRPVGGSEVMQGQLSPSGGHGPPAAYRRAGDTAGCRRAPGPRRRRVRDRGLRRCRYHRIPGHRSVWPDHRRCVRSRRARAHMGHLAARSPAARRVAEPD